MQTVAVAMLVAVTLAVLVCRWKRPPAQILQRRFSMNKENSSNLSTVSPSGSSTDKGKAKGIEQVPNRIYKSRLFVMIFSDRKELLELYNAMSGKHYTDPELLTINTLENAIYMSMQNDVSFLIDSRLSLYEHQSTYSPNLPLRFFFYLADLYSVMTINENLYGTRKVMIPPPQFIIFYNGQEERPDQYILRLSDLYSVEEKEHMLELEAVMLNINQGHNPKLMQTCRTLRDYAEYTARVRKYAAKMTLSDAVELAITECIREGILKEFLEQNRAEVKKVSIYEYDEEKHMRQEREAAWEDGKKEGMEQLLLSKIKRKLAKGKTIPEIADELEETEERISELIDEMNKEQ